MSSMDRAEKEGSGTEPDEDAVFDGELNFSGPPEPVVKDGKPTVFIPNGRVESGSPPAKVVPLGRFVCQRCGRSQDMPLTDAGFQEPHECPGCDRQGPFDHAEIPMETAEEMLDALDLIGHEVTGVEDTRIDSLWGDVREYISTYWKAKDENYYDVMTAWVIGTWLRPNQEFGTHLLTMGPTTAGKTRMLKTLARLSYRGVVMVTATEAALRRAVDKHDITPFISEYHDINHEVQRQIDALIKGGQKREEIALVSEESRGGGYDAARFELFSNVGIASQYDPADDIINRTVQIQAKKSASAPAMFRGSDDEDIRNRLLFTRFQYLDSPEWDAAFEDALDWCIGNDISARTREKVVSLFTVAHLFDREDDFIDVIEWMDEMDADAAADSTDANLVASIRNLANRELASGGAVIGKDEDLWADLSLPYSDIVEHYNRRSGEDRTASWLGHRISNLGLGTEKKWDGTYVSDPDLKEKLADYCDAYNLDLTNADEIERPVRELPPDDHFTGTCSECGERGDIRFKHIEGHFICTDCADEYTATRPRGD